MTINSKDAMAYGKIKFYYNKMNYSESYDVLYHYMSAYMKDTTDRILFRDEVENLLGLNTHAEIIKYIIEDLY